jgi:hypothetical protein
MNKKITLLGGVVAAALLSPGIASASFLLDTGIPTGGASNELNASQWFAAEFSATAGDTISSISAYLTAGPGQPANVPNTFTIDLYSDSNFTGRANTRVLVDSVQGTFTGDGWNLTSVNWAPLATTGNYWVALQVDSGDGTNGLDVPTESSTETGTAPALGFAYLGPNTSSKYTTSGTPAFGVEVSTVPIPAALWLLGSGLLGLGAVGRRNRRSSAP